MKTISKYTLVVREYSQTHPKCQTIMAWHALFMKAETLEHRRRERRPSMPSRNVQSIESYFKGTQQDNIAHQLIVLLPHTFSPIPLATVLPFFFITLFFFLFPMLKLHFGSHYQIIYLRINRELLGKARGDIK